LITTNSPETNVGDGKLEGCFLTKLLAMTLATAPGRLEHLNPTTASEHPQLGVIFASRGVGERKIEV